MTPLAGLVRVRLPFPLWGVAWLLHASPLAFSPPRRVSNAYLVRPGARLPWSSRHGRAAAKAPPRISAWVVARQGAIDPKPLPFMFTPPPRFVELGHGSALARLLALGPVQKACGGRSAGTPAGLPGPRGLRR